MHGAIDRLVQWALAATLGLMTCLVFAGVLFRYFLNLPLTWTEELASLLFAWLTFVGAFVGFRTRSHIAIDSLMLLAPRRVRDATARLADVVVLLLLVLFVWQGVTLTIRTWSLEFPAMEISRGYLYLSLPIGASLMIVAVLKAWQREPRLGAPSADEGEVRS
jgi:TRAP-type C4-dicarboxylate transport system permease small subunit